MPQPNLIQQIRADSVFQSLPDSAKLEFLQRVQNRLDQELISAGSTPQEAATSVRQATVGRSGLPPRRRRAEEFLERARVPIITAGALIGGVAASPIPGIGPIGGGALGSMAGEGINQALAAGAESLGLTRPGFGLKSLPEQLSGMGREGLIDVAIPGGAAVARPVARAGLRRFAMVGTRGRQVMAQAKELLDDFGVTAEGGLLQASDNPLIRSFQRVVGIVPLAASPLRKAAFRRIDSVRAALKKLESKILNDVPEVAVADLSVRAVEDARNLFGVARTEIDEAYATARGLAEGTNAQVPLIVTKARAQELLETITGALPTRTVRRGEEVTREAYRRAVPNRLVRQLRQILELDDAVSYKEFRTLVDDVSEILDDLEKRGFRTQFREATILKEAMKVDRKGILEPSVRAAFAEADKLTAKWMSVFETPTAKKFTRVDKRIFDVGFERTGDLNADELLERIATRKSPEAVRDLQKLVSPETFRAAVGNRFRRTFGSLRTTLLETENLKLLSAENLTKEVRGIRTGLGLEDPLSTEFAVTREMLKGTGVTMKQIGTFLDVAEESFREGVPAVSQFLRRRGVIGGFRSVAKGLLGTTLTTGGAGLIGGPGGALLTVSTLLSLRGFGRWITNPQALRNMTQAIRPNVSQQVRDAALARLLLGGTRQFYGESSRIVGRGFDALTAAYRREMQEQRPSLENLRGFATQQ